MNLWRMIRGMFGTSRPPRDPSVTISASESHAQAAKTRDLLAQIRTEAEKRRLSNARRHYEERMYGTGNRLGGG